MLLRRIGIVVVLGVLGGEAANAAPPRAPEEWIEDAALNDVFFLDPDRGWAVGDRGAIWRTVDGGRQWRLQPAPVGCRLHGVWFLDRQNGWAVGGWTHAYTHKSSGVVLRSEDGGATWRELPSSATPALRRIRMFDSQCGWALGAASPLYPAGVFRTENGGRGWAPVGGDRPAGWETGDFHDPLRGVLAGRGGAALVGVHRFQPAAAPLTPQQIVRQVRLAGDRAAWLVGDGGLVLHSSNGGAVWGPPPAAPPGSKFFDFHALAAWGAHVWIAGAPGTRVFHSSNGGAAWEEFSTAQRLPIRAMFFLDEQHGWAVGELGLILATRDGGRTWVRQRGGGARLGVLGVFAEPQRTPWELLVRLAGGEGYLSGGEYLLLREEQSLPSAETSLEDRAREAMLVVGGSAAAPGAFPAPPPGLTLPLETVLESWRETEDGAALQRGESSLDPALRRLEERLVRKIRQWRPDVLVTEPVLPTGADSLAQAIGQTTLNAALKADDPDAYPEHARLGLAPWTVKKLYSVAPPGEAGSVTLLAASLAPQTGGALADGAASARALLDAEFHPSPEKIELHNLLDRTAEGRSRGGDVAARLNLPTPGEARRRLHVLSAGNLDLVAKIAQKQRNVQQIVAHHGTHSREALVGQVDELLRELPPTAAGNVLFQLATQLRREGRADLAAELDQRLVQQHPQHGATEAALVRLVQHGVGSETVAAADQRQRDAAVLALGQTIAASRVALYAEPRLRFALAAAARRQGEVREAERFFRQLASREGAPAWRACAAGELWLMNPVGPPPKPMVRCLSTRHKPYLDGRLDDEVWRAASPLELVHGGQAPAPPVDGDAASEGEPAAAAYLARDDEYLYFAVRCRKVPQIDYAASKEPRVYDAPLEDRDRVELLIDLDRDYATYYRLAVDHRGHTADAGPGGPWWNPTWYVAAAEDDQSWTIEAAIPLAELSSQPPRLRDVWAVGVQRVIPGAGFQAWTLPAAVGNIRPEGFGYVALE